MEQVKIIEVKSEIAAGTRGASLGVDALKTASLDKGSDFFARFDAEEVENENDLLFNGFEYPDPEFLQGVLTMEERVCEATFQTIAKGNFPLVIAGDHSTAAGTICGIKKAHPNKKLGVIWIDAHGDLHTPYTTPSGNMHGMPLAMVCQLDNLESRVNEPSTQTLSYWELLKTVGLKKQKVAPSDLVFIAVRDTEKPEQFLMNKYGMKNFTPNEIKAKGIKQVASEAQEILSHCDIIYVSFDVDSMDSKISEGTGTPVPNGLSVEEALELNTILIKNPKVCAWEIVEVNPTLDSQNLMAENAFDILEATVAALESRDTAEQQKRPESLV